MRGGVFICLLCDLVAATEVPAEIDLDEDEGNCFSIEGSRV